MYTIDSNRKSPVRRQSVLFYLMAPFPPQMVGFIVMRRLRDPIITVRTACAEAVAAMAARSVLRLSEASIEGAAAGAGRQRTNQGSALPHCYDRGGIVAGCGIDVAAAATAGEAGARALRRWHGARLLAAVKFLSSAEAARDALARAVSASEVQGIA